MTDGMFRRIATEVVAPVVAALLAWHDDGIGTDGTNGGCRVALLQQTDQR